MLLASVLPAAENDALLFSFFRNNGEDGLYLATSDDGLSWRVLNGDRPLLKPEVGESKLMRDPSITRGPDGTFHLVWTTSWEGSTIGYASSKNLIEWSAQRAIPVMMNFAGVKNCWAPEVYFDQESRDCVVVWASTVGEASSTIPEGGRRRDHRLYAFRTADFKTISESKLFYDPGFSVIDGAIFLRQSGDDRYTMVVKNEVPDPPAKYLFLVSARTLDGPWTQPGERISGEDWAEGASPLRLGDYWYIYFDKYRNKRYGAIRSKDLTRWQDVTDQITFPEGVRHGTGFRAPREIVQQLDGATQP